MIAGTVCAEMMAAAAEIL